MTWTPTTVTLLDGNQVAKTFIAYTDGTSFSFAHPLLDTAGAILNPATAGNQATEITSLAAIAGSVAGATPAGANIIGKVGIDQTTPGTTNGVYVNTIAAGTNTIGAFTTGGQVVTGQTITRPADTTAYAAGDLVANSTVAGSVTYPTIAAARGADIVSTATRVRFSKTGTSLTNAQFRIHFYNIATPTVSNGDNAAWLTAVSGYIGFFDVTCTQAFTDSAQGVGYPGSGSMMTFSPISGTSNLVFLVEARNAYTPISGEVFTVKLEVN